MDGIWALVMRIAPERHELCAESLLALSLDLGSIEALAVVPVTHHYG
jgi:hypothetical protein